MMLQSIVVLCGLAISVMADDRPDPAVEKERKLLAGLWEFAEPKGGEAARSSSPFAQTGRTLPSTRTVRSCGTGRTPST